MNDLDSFFEELNTSLSKARGKYKNFVIMGDFNIDVKLKGNCYRKLEEFFNMFNLANLVDTETCVTNSDKSTIDLILTNKPSSFQKTMATKVCCKYGATEIGMAVFMDDMSAIGDTEEIRKEITNCRKMETLKKFEYGLKKTKILIVRTRKGEVEKTGKSAAGYSAGNRQV